jgi:DNA modification methylase
MTIAENLLPLATSLDELRLLEGNPRRGNVDAVARSLARFGQLKPIVARLDGTIVAGNHTFMAARQLGWTHLAVVRTDADEATAKAFALADNRTSELGGYDEQALLDLLTEVQEADESLLAAASFDASDLEDLLERLSPPAPPVAVDLDDVPTTAPKITKPGDLWLLGPHRLLCGDCRNVDDVARVLDGDPANLAMTSPPYAQQRDYDPSSGFKPIRPDDYVEWFEPVAANIAAHLATDGSWFLNITPGAEDRLRRRYVLDLVVAHLDWGWLYHDDYAWPAGQMPVDPRQIGRFKQGFEMIYGFVRSTTYKFRPEAVMHASDDAFTYGGTDARISHDQQGDPELSRRSNLQNRGPGLAFPSTLLSKLAKDRQTGHTAAFPVALPRFFVKAYTDAGDHVLDPFVGSGSTILAAHETDRIGHGIELSAGYVDVACRRFQQVTGIKPILEGTGETYDFEAATDAGS